MCCQDSQYQSAQRRCIAARLPHDVDSHQNCLRYPASQSVSRLDDGRSTVEDAAAAMHACIAASDRQVAKPGGADGRGGSSSGGGGAGGGQPQQTLARLLLDEGQVMFGKARTHRLLREWQSFALGSAEHVDQLELVQSRTGFVVSSAGSGVAVAAHMLGGAFPMGGLQLDIWTRQIRAHAINGRYSRGVSICYFLECCILKWQSSCGTSGPATCLLACMLLHCALTIEL